MDKTVLMVLGSVLAGSLVTPATASAQIPTAGVIYACVRLDRDAAEGRLVRLVAEQETCRRREVRVRWNVEGPPGPQGPAGPPGATGPSGPQGPSGLPCLGCVDRSSLASDVERRLPAVSSNGDLMLQSPGPGWFTLGASGLGVAVQGVNFMDGDIHLGTGRKLYVGGLEALTGPFNFYRYSESELSPHSSPQFSFRVGIDSEAGPQSVALGSAVRAGTGSFVFGDASGSEYPFDAALEVGDNAFVARATGGVAFLTATSPAAAGVSLAPGSGAWDSLSDRNSKTEWAAASPEFFLQGLARMPIQSWRYVSQSAGIRHVGPTAQDFRAAFGLGTNDTTISTVDADGVSMLAIKALAERTDALRAAVDRARSLERDLAETRRRLESLDARVAQLESRLRR